MLKFVSVASSLYFRSSLSLCDHVMQRCLASVVSPLSMFAFAGTHTPALAQLGITLNSQVRGEKQQRGVRV